MTEDVVVRELEGVRGAVTHLVSPAGDPLYDGVVVDGIDLNVATPTSVASISAGVRIVTVSPTA